MPRITITAPGKMPQPYSFPLDGGNVTIGRGEDNIIVITDGSVSGRHAEMARIAGGYELRDLGSTNGLKVAGQHCTVVPLNQGDVVSIGDVEFAFSLSGEEMEILAAEKTAAIVSGEGKEKMVELKKALPVLSAAPAETPVAPRAESPTPLPELAAPKKKSSRGLGIGALVLFLILAGLAFCAGVAIRFQKETGKSLIDTLRSKKPEAQQKAKP